MTATVWRFEGRNPRGWYVFRQDPPGEPWMLPPLVDTHVIPPSVFWGTGCEVTP